MAAALTGLGSKPTIHDLPRCACGCGRPASRGFPGDMHYASACVPPAMRFPWEVGHLPPDEVIQTPPTAKDIVSAASAADLFPGFQPG